MRLGRILEKGKGLDTIQGGRLALLAALAASGLIPCGCAAGDSSESESKNSPGPGDGASPGNTGELPGTGTGTGTGSMASGTGGTAPQEVEVDVQFELPHAGKRYVYSANPERDSVAVIDGTTLAIDTVEVGDEPRFLQTLATTADDNDSAIVLNVKSSDATVIRTEGGESKTSFVNVASGANAIAVSPNGQHAVVYLNSDYSTGDSVELESQSVSVLTLEPGYDHATTLSVGYRPSAVSFSDDNSRAFVVTNDGVSILDFAEIERTGPTAAPTVPVSRSVSVKAFDVSITRDGKYALAREQGSAVLRLVDLNDQTSHELDLAPLVGRAIARSSANNKADHGAAGAAGSSGSDDVALPTVVEVTDIDLSPNNDFVVAVIRSQDIVLTIPMPGAFDDPNEVTALRLNAGFVGSVTLSPDARWALLYTTVDPNQEHLTLLELASQTTRTIDLRKSIRAVAVDESSKIALVMHQKIEGNPNDTQDADLRIDRSYGYSLVNIESRFARLEVTPGEITAFDLIPEADKLFALFADQPRVQCTSLTSFVPEDLSLASHPLSIGALPNSKKVFVGQEHPDGRITFIDWTTLEMTSVTGFELNSELEER